MSYLTYFKRPVYFFHVNDISNKNTFLLLALPQMLDSTPDAYFIFCLVLNNGCEAEC